MDANVEQELFIEDLLNQINLDIYFPKFNNDLLKALIMNMFRDSPEIFDVLKQYSQMFFVFWEYCGRCTCHKEHKPKFSKECY